VSEVGAHPSSVIVRVVEAEVRRNREGNRPEEIAHRVQGVPRVPAIGVGIGPLEHFPELVFEVALEVFSEFARVTRELGLQPDVPGQHFHELDPCDSIEHVLGVDYFLTPQTLGDVGAYPPEFVAAVEERLGRWWSRDIAAFADLCQRPDHTVLIQEDQARIVLGQLIELLCRVEGEVDQMPSVNCIR